MRASQYSSKKVIFLGLVHFVLGALSITLGIASATRTQGNFPYGQIGYGIWGGILYIVNGIIAVAAGTTRSPDLIVSHLTLSIVVAVIASLQFSLGVASAVQDNTLVNIRQTFNIVPYDPNSGSGSGSSAGTTTTADPDVQRYYNALEEFYSDSGKNILSYLIRGDYRSSSNELTKYVHRGTVAVDCLLAITGILMGLTAVLSSGSGCRVTCCSDLDMEGNQFQEQLPSNGMHPATGHNHCRTIDFEQNKPGPYNVQMTHQQHQQQQQF